LPVPKRAGDAVERRPFHWNKRQICGRAVNAAIADAARQELQRERVDVGHGLLVEHSLTLHEGA